MAKTPKQGAGTKRFAGKSAMGTPRAASTGGKPHPSKGTGSVKGRSTKFGV